MRPPGDPHEGMRCEMILCVDGGSVMEIKWMPLGAWDTQVCFKDRTLSVGLTEFAPSQDDAGNDGISKLGIIAAVQLDGSISFYVVPSPDALRSARSLQIEVSPIFGKPNPIKRYSATAEWSRSQNEGAAPTAIGR